MSTPTPAPPSAQLGFETELFKAADKLRGNMEPSDYKHVALGLIFLKYISDAFEARHRALLAEDPQAAEDRDEYLADNVFWVPKAARWSHLQAQARQPTIGGLIDDAMRAIEKDNESLKGVLPKDYARPALNKVMLGELIDLISGIALNEDGDRARDVLGRVYEYFLGQFAGAEEIRHAGGHPQARPRAHTGPLRRRGGAGRRRRAVRRKDDAAGGAVARTAGRSRAAGCGH